MENKLQRSKNPPQLCGLNKNPNLTSIFQSAATKVISYTGAWHDFYAALLIKGRKPELARLNFARKIAAVTLSIWKKGECFDADKLKLQV